MDDYGLTRCGNCNDTRLYHYAQRYHAALSVGMTDRQALARSGARRFCCRQRLMCALPLAPVDRFAPEREP